MSQLHVRATSEHLGDADTDDSTAIASGGWREACKRIAQKAKADRISMVAGSIAYHGFLALFPVLIALVGIVEILGLSQQTVSTIVRGAGKTLPQGASGVLSTALEAAHNRTGGAWTVTIIAIVVAIWSASGGMSIVETGLDVAYELPTERKFLPSRLRGFLLLAIVIVLGGSASAVTVFAKPLGHELEQLSPVSGTAFNAPWTALRWVVAIVLMVTLFSLLYWLGPNRERPKWRWLTAGAVVATGVWLLASFGLSFYVSALGSYGKTYGGLAGVAIFLFWFYLTGLATLLGAEVDADRERIRASI
jgi:membrane protein